VVPLREKIKEQFAHKPLHALHPFVLIRRSVAWWGKLKAVRAWRYKNWACMTD
jgi:hypothetical protein